MAPILSNNVSLFKDIEPADLDNMYSCLSGVKRSFTAGETVCSFDNDSLKLGIITKGIVRLERTDFFGDTSMLDRLEVNDIIGDISVYSSVDENEVSAVCEKDCEVIFINHEKIINPCEQICPCHITMTKNLLTMIATKAERLSLRVEVLSHKNIRSKLMSFFSMEAKRAGSNSFTLPFSVSTLASYICVDRSAMMREIAKMKKDGLIEADRRNITLLEQ